MKQDQSNINECISNLKDNQNNQKITKKQRQELKLKFFSTLNLKQYYNLKQIHLQDQIIPILPNIDLIYNLQKIRILGCQVQNIDEFSLGQYKNLQQLNLTLNLIQYFPALIALNIVYITVSQNQIRQIDDFMKGNYPKLKRLSLNYNKIVKIPKLKLPSLLMLGLNDNQIIQIDEYAFQQCQNLEQLDFSDNRQLRKLPKLNLYKLKQVYCYFTLIQQLDCISKIKYPQLVVLMFAYNNIKILPVINAPNLLNFELGQISLNNINNFIKSEINQMVELNLINCNYINGKSCSILRKNVNLMRCKYIFGQNV